MFIALDSKPLNPLRPFESKIAEGDWEVLSHFWYPVCLEADLGGAPLKATLLDVDLVLYRGADGEVAVAPDMCPHRHIRLSGGRVVDGQIECPFHGLRFNAAGKCTLIPALGAGHKLPDSYRLKTLPTCTRYGLVWTCLGDPDRHSLPKFNAFDDEIPPDSPYVRGNLWPMSAPRQIENFVDLAHLPFVHANTLGGNQASPIKPGRIEHADDGLTLHASYLQTPFGGDPRAVTLTYRIVLPFAIELTSGDSDNDPLQCFNIAAPVTAHTCRVFAVVKPLRVASEGLAALVEGLDQTADEDIRVLAGLRIDDMPLDQRHEIHLPIDNISNAYRERLRDLGLGRGRAAPGGGSLRAAAQTPALIDQ